MLAVDWYTADYTRRPPGMSWDDYQAWHPWITGPGRAWPQYAYDVELYTQDIPPDTADQDMIRMWARNTARRIDAVGWRNGRHTIFEARRRAGWSAIAQLEGYAVLWRLQFPHEPLEGLVLVSEEIPDDVRAVARTRGIKTWVVGETGPS